MLGALNSWYIIKFNNKTTLSEEFDGIHKGIIDGNNGNMSSLVHSGKHGAINTAYTTTMV